MRQSRKKEKYRWRGSNASKCEGTWGEEGTGGEDGGKDGKCHGAMERGRERARQTHPQTGRREREKVREVAIREGERHGDEGWGREHERLVWEVTRDWCTSMCGRGECLL